MSFNSSILKKYALPSENSWNEIFYRVAQSLGKDDKALQNRLYDYMLQKWFIPASPILINAGTERGLTASCFMTEAADSMYDIFATALEMGIMSKASAGVAVNFSKIRGLGSPIQNGDLGRSTGIQPFLKLYESSILCSRQAELRRGSCAVYLRIDHPDILDFLKTRQTVGDMSVLTPNLFTGVVIPDWFMELLREERDYQLVDPHSGPTNKWLNTKEVFKEILKQRHSTGLPYIFFEDNANRYCLPHEQKNGRLKVEFSSLCSEQMHVTNSKRSGVCVLSSINLSKYDEWKDSFQQLVEDIVTALDNTSEDFIKASNHFKGMGKALYSVYRTREIGIGWNGFHDYILSKGWAFDSVMARGFDISVTTQLREYAIQASKKLAKERGACPDSKDWGEGDMRNIRLLSMMPTQSVSQIIKTSKSIEPYFFPAYTLSTDTGNRLYKVKQLETVLEPNDPRWDMIVSSGTVKGLGLSEDQESLFRNAYEISQRSILSMAIERQKAMSGTGNYAHSQSINLFYPAKASLKQMADDLIWYWENGGVTCYYVESSKNEYSSDGCFACSA